MPDTSLVSK